ncbi:replication initiation protein [Helicobacter suis]|uniref:replication initiation protein n=1 Tax=Helicobacter suis TaxID=104628 RepID=UPI0013D6273E|nr:replication initiation protein [Helicobacter suis]
MDVTEEEQAIKQQIKTLQILIDNEADPVLKSILEQKQKTCLQTLITLIELASTTQQNKQGTPQKQDNLPAQTTPSPLTLDKSTKSESIPSALVAIPAKDLRIANPSQVVLHNDIYRVNLGVLGAWESNLLFTIFNKFKDNGNTLVRFTPREVKEMIGNTDIANKDLARVVKKLWNRIKTANFWVLLPRRDENHMLFTTFAIDYYDDAKTQVKGIEIQVNTPYFGYLLNSIHGNFTSFQLKQFTSFRSKYAKTLYRLLVRFENVKDKGVCNMLTYQSDFESFKEFMGVPKNLAIVDIEKRILIPACKELGTLLNAKDTQWDPQNPNRDLPYETIFYKKHKKGRGNKVVGITFHFTTHPHIEAQKAIMKRNSQNRIQDAITKKQEEQAKEEKKAKSTYYTKKEYKTLRGFINSVGRLMIKDNDNWYAFESVKLLGVLVFMGGNDSRILCQFQILDQKRYDSSLIQRLQHDNKYFPKIPKEAEGSNYFAYIFDDHESFIKDFAGNAK